MTPPPSTLTFVTGNAGKVAELSALLAPLGVALAQDRRGYPEVQADSLAEVTSFGATHLLAAGLAPPFVLEDSGLFVDALQGFPGVYSRHALDTVGLPGLLHLLEGLALPPSGRGAAFRTDLAYVDAAGTVHHFAGECRGRILAAPRGHAGFGFDPIFVPEGHTRTFAEMDVAEKSALSHRGQAVRALVRHLIQTAKP